MVFGIWMARIGWPAVVRLLGDDSHRVGGIVAADIEKRVDFVGAHDRKISWQYLRSGLSRVEPSAAAGVTAIASRLTVVSRERSTRSSSMMPRTPWMAP